MNSKITIIKKNHKSKMYACFAFFPDGTVKRWKYVTDLHSFGNFLVRSHSSWKYFNVYEKGTKSFLKRFYPGNVIPKTLVVLLAFGIGLLTHKFTFNNTFKKSGFSNLQYPLKNTFNETTFINGFNNTATIRTPSIRKGGNS